MRIRPEAQAILERSVPGRLDSLWCEMLASSYGARLLEAWDLTLEQVRASAPAIECIGAEVLHWASLHGHLNSPLCAAEWVAEDVLMRLPTWQGPPLEHFTGGDVEYHEVDIRDVYALAFAEGLEEAQERHYLEAARRVWPVLDQMLEFSARPISSYTRAYQWTQRNGPIDCAQLALACLRNPALKPWMESLGVAEWRLPSSLLEIHMQVSVERLRWLTPACQEARLLGSASVTPDHLLLALLGEPQGLAVRMFREHGVDIGDLRRRISSSRGQPVAVRHMEFAADLLAVVADACAADGQDPYSGVLLECLLARVDYPEIPAAVLPALQQRLTGWLPSDPRILSLDGLRLGMSEAEVQACLGPPSFRKDGNWMYRYTSVSFVEGRVQGILGEKLLLGPSGDSLERGADWLQAERVLGALRLWYGGPGPASAIVSGGRVKMLTLSLDDSTPP